MAEGHYQHFSVVHQLKRRVRFIAPVLRKDPERAYIFTILLSKREGIVKIKVVAEIASVTVIFDPDCLPLDNLLTLLDKVIDNLGRQPHARISAIGHKHKQSNRALREYFLGIGGMSCASCALFLELMLQRHPDIASANVNYLSETARIKTSLPQQALFDLVESHQYHAYAIDSLSQRKWILDLEQVEFKTAGRKLVMISLLSVPVLVLSLYENRSLPFNWLQALLATTLVFIGGRDIFRKAWALAKQRHTNMDSLVALGVGSAYIYSLPALFRPAQHVYFDAAAAIIELVMLGRYIEALAKNRMIGSIRKLVDLQPSQATQLHGDTEFIVKADRIAEGDILLIRPGEKIPVDGIVIKGLSSVNEALISGFSKPVIKEPGHPVYDGSLNGGGSLQVRATKAGKDTLLANLVHMVDQSQTTKLPIQKAVDRFAAIFVPAVMGVAVLTFAGGWLRRAKTAHALANAIAVLLISCPCALGLATPAATTVGSHRAAKRGIYIRNGDAIEVAAQVDTVVFDKTGTLTEGNAEISDLFNISSYDDDMLIQWAASAEYHSEHLLGQAIVRHAREQQIDLLEASHFFSAADRGIRADVAGHSILLGNQLWLEQQDITTGLFQATAKKLAKQGKTLIYLVVDQQLSGLFALTDPVRAHAKQAVTSLHEQRIETLMVTGDNEPVAQMIAGQLGITRLKALATPEEKLQIVRKLQQQGHCVAMVGDGINDAPALAAANLSLAIDRGTDIAIEASDLILLNGDINRVADAIRLSRETRINIFQNLFWAVAYNTVAIPVAVAGKLTPTVASLAMALSSVSVIVNSMRLKKDRPTRDRIES